MPTVPRYSQQTEERGIPNVRVDAGAPLIEAFGGGRAMAQQAEATREMLGTVNQMVQREKRKADDTILADADSQLLNRVNDITYSDPDSVITRKGKAVVETDFYKDYNDRYDKAADDIAGSIKSADALDMFNNRIRSQRKSSFNAVLDRHYATERHAYRKEAAGSNVTALREDSIKNNFQHSRVLDNLQKQEGILRDLAAEEGMSPEGANNLVLEERSKTYTGIIEDMTAAKNYQGARALFDRLTRKSAPGMITKGTLDWESLPGTKNADGSVSSTVTIGVDGGDVGMKPGTEVLIPSFWDGKRHSADEAIARFKETGKHLGVFANAQAAQQYVEQDLHPAQERQGQGYVYDNLTQKDEKHLEKVLEESGVDDQSLRLAQSIMLKHPGDMAAQFAERDKIKDPKVYDAVTHRLDRLNAESEAVKKQAKENDINSAADYIKNTQGVFDDDRQKVPPAIRARLTEKDWKVIDALVYPPMETDWGTYTYLWDMAANDPEKFMATNFMEYRPYLNDQDYRAINKQKGLMQQRDEKAQEEINNYKVSKGTSDRYAVALGLNPKAKAGYPKQQYDAFAAAFQEQVIAAQKAKGKPLNDTEVEEVGKKFTTQFAVDRSFLGINYKSNLKLGNMNASQIPDDENKIIINELKRRNMPITDDNRLKLYRIWKGL